MQTKPKVSAMKRETVKGGKVTKQVVVKTPSKRIMVMSESGKPQSLADRTARANAFANELTKVKAMGMKPGAQKAVKYTKKK